MIKFVVPVGVNMSFINQNSFTIIAVASVGLLAFFLFRKGFETRNLFLVGALTLGLMLSFLLLQPGSSTTQDSADVLAQIGSGQPVLLEFQSNY
jgi:hypothetical protein